MRKNLLSISADAKTTKGEKLGYLTGMLSLAPFNLSGVNVCPFAKVAGCFKPCLNLSGRGAFSNVQKARLNKTLFFFNERETFFDNLWLDIEKLSRLADRRGMIPVVRLNGLSDIEWEGETFTRDGIEYPNIFAAFPNVQFYDYTKNPRRDRLPKNYDLTFSLSGAKDFARFNALALSRGMRCAAVYRGPMPREFMGRRTINGDDTDLRFLDRPERIIMLKAKGKARTDRGAFVFDF
jgi:hypothetical protein